MSRLSRHRTFLALWLVAGLAAGALWAQPATTTRPAAARAAATAPAGPGMLTRVPEQAVAFVTVKNLADAGAKMDQFIADIGLGAMVPGKVLDMIKQQAEVGPGFNDNGGLTLILLDPGLLGYKPEEVFDQDGPPEGLPSPVVFLLPVADPKTLFMNATASEEDGFTRLEMGMDLIYAKAVNGYTALAKDPAALKILLGAQRPVMAKMPKRHLAVMNESDIVGYADLKTLQPWIQAAVKKGEQDMEQMRMMAAQGFMPPPMAMMLNIYSRLLPFYRDLLGQMEAVTAGAKIGPSGIVINQFMTYLPDSKMAGMMKAMQAKPGPLLNQMPALPYVLAFGTAETTAPQDPNFMSQQQQMLDQVLDAILADTTVSPAVKIRLRQLALELCNQFKSMRGYLGASAPGAGVFGLALVYNVQNADAFMQNMPELVSLKQQVINALLASAPEMGEMGMMMAPTAPATAPAATGPAAPKVVLQYLPAAATVEGASVAAVEISIPELAAADPNIAATLTKVLGEGKARFYIAKVDDQTVVVTFGGAQPFLAEAVKAARGGRDLAVDPAVAAAMKEMPPDAASVALINLANLVEQIKSAVAAIAGPEAAADFPLANVQFQSQTPIAMGQSIADNGQYQRTFIPTAVVADVVRAALMIQQQMMGGMGPGMEGGAPSPGQQDF